MTLGANWSSCWNAVETWNEPEGGFGANLPADQMMPGAKAMRYGLYHAAPAVKLGAAGFTSIAPSGNYHRTAAKNGLLDNADFVSFHTYGDAESLITLTRQYREWLAANGKSGMPLRLTEVSRVAWDNFRTGEESLKIAAELAMQAAVGRAVGLEQLYFFAYYELKEGNKTFGFLAPDRTPRLSFAAFLQSVRRLGHTRYAGKLRTGNRMIRSARVYTGDRGCVTVLETTGGGTFAPPYPVCRVEGLDGRVIAGNADGSVPLPDPVVYLLSDTVPEELLDTGTPENRLAALAGLPGAGTGRRLPRSCSFRILIFRRSAVTVPPAAIRLRRELRSRSVSTSGISPPRRRRRSSPSTPGLCWLRGKPHNPSSCRPAAKSGWISRS